MSTSTYILEYQSYPGGDCELPEKLEDYAKRVYGVINTKSIEDIYSKVEQGELQLRDPHPPKSLWSYLLRLDYSLWFHTSLVLALVAVILSWYGQEPLLVRVLRYAFASFYALFLTGYSIVEAIYPDPRALTNIEKLAYSIGLSLSVDPLIGLVLNYSPWGLTLHAYLVSSIIVIVLSLIAAAYRKYRLVRGYSRGGLGF